MNDVLTSTPLKSDLTEDEQNQRQELELVVATANDMNARAVQALTKIRDQRLYRDKYATFEEYCRVKWGFGRSYINRQIGAAHVVEVLGPIGAKLESESVARPLVGLSDKEIVTAYEAAQQMAGDKPLTAKIIGKAAAQFKPEQPIKKVAPLSCNVSTSDLKPVFAQLAKVEAAALASKNKRLFKELKALRKCLEMMAATTGLKVEKAGEEPKI